MNEDGPMYTPATVEERAEAVGDQLKRLMDKVALFKEKGFKKLPASMLADFEFLFFVITLQADANQTLKERLSMLMGEGGSELVDSTGASLDTTYDGGIIELGH